MRSRKNSKISNESSKMQWVVMTTEGPYLVDWKPTIGQDDVTEICWNGTNRIDADHALYRMISLCGE